jgi:glutamine synthetase
MSNELRNFLTLSYDELEQLNLKAKEQRKNRVALHKVQKTASSTSRMRRGSRP